MLARRHGELVGLFQQMREPDGITGAAAALTDWLEMKGLPDLARRVTTSHHFPELVVDLPTEFPLPEGARFVAKGGVPGTVVPAPLMGSLFSAHPHILDQSGHITITAPRLIQPSSRLARECPNLDGFSGALYLEGTGEDRVPWEVLLQQFKGIHTLGFSRCVLEHRPGLARKKPESFPALRSLTLEQCSRMTIEGSHILGAPMFSGIHSLNMVTRTGSGTVPDVLTRKETLPLLGKLALDCPGVHPGHIEAMPAMSDGGLQSLELKWCVEFDGAGPLMDGFSRGRGDTFDLGVFTPGRDAEWAGYLERHLKPGHLKKLGFSTHVLTPEVIRYLAKAIRVGGIRQLTLEDDTREPYPLQNWIGELLPALPGLECLRISTWQPGVAEKIIESKAIGGLSEFSLIGRIPSIEFLRRHFISQAARMHRVDLIPLYHRAETGLSLFLEENLRGTSVEVLRGRYLPAGENA